MNRLVINLPSKFNSLKHSGNFLRIQRNFPTSAKLSGYGCVSTTFSCVALIAAKDNARKNLGFSITLTDNALKVG